jgi:hypothetical protein
MYREVVLVRVSTAAVALAMSVLLTVGCTAGDSKKRPQPPAGAATSGSASSPAPAAATVDLQKAVEELTKTSYRYTMKAGDATGSGSVDQAAKQRSMTVTVAAEGEDYKTEVLILDTETYVRISGLPVAGLDGKKWLRVDLAKIKSFAALGIRDIDDPTGVKTLSRTIATIEKTGERSYKGTLDLSKGSAAFGLDEAAVRQLGEKAKAIPFEATVNDKGKVATWKMTVPPHGSEKEVTYELAFTNHGERFPLTKPASATVTSAPDAVYQMLQA